MNSFMGHGGALRQDLPRVPLPQDAETLRAGTVLGRQIAALLDPETDVPGVTSAPIRKELQGLGEFASSSNPQSAIHNPPTSPSPPAGATRGRAGW